MKVQGLDRAGSQLSRGCHHDRAAALAAQPIVTCQGCDQVACRRRRTWRANSATSRTPITLSNQR